MDFTETLTLALPNVEERVAVFSEREYNKNHGLIVEIAAIHEGTTANFRHYPAAELQTALGSWVSPYPKPIIMNHDPMSEPVGRVMGAKMEEEADGTPYTMLQVAITSPEAIAKILDGRYLTGSVGGKADEALCNICGADWAQASMQTIPCRHRPGKSYKGKIMAHEMRRITWKEYSIVNMPADDRSGVRSISVAGTESNGEDDGWIRTARVFSLDMNNESIVELAEAQDRNVLEGLKKKNASTVYMQLKGAFLSTLATAVVLEEETDKEKDMENIVEADEDILAVAEELSSDLAAPAEEAEVVAEETDEVAEEAAVEEEAEEAATEEAAEETAEVEEAEEAEEATEGERPQGQEKAHGSDVDANDSTGADKTREAEEAEPVAEEETVEEGAAETDLNETVKALESRVEELTAREAALLEENAKLKAALKRGLAERVVDTKIALGLVEADERAALLEEHVARSAASLADSLRDLSAMPPKARNTFTGSAEMTVESAAVAEEGNVVTEGEPDTAVESDEVNPEDFFVNVLMGRTQI